MSEKMKNLKFIKQKNNSNGFSLPHFSLKGITSSFLRQKRTVRQTQLRKNGAGFTLIELLVVIAIIGLLASVVLVAVNSARQKARDAKRVGDLNQLAKAMELYFNDASAYPTGVGAIGASTNYVPATVGLGGNVFGSAQLVAFNAALAPAQIYMTPTYIASVPTSPTPFDGSCNSSTNRYLYETNMTGTTYTFTFCLGNVTGNVTAGVHYLTPVGIR